MRGPSYGYTTKAMHSIEYPLPHLRSRFSDILLFPTGFPILFQGFFGGVHFGGPPERDHVHGDRLLHRLSRGGSDRSQGAVGLLRGTIVDRTYGIHKTYQVYLKPYLLTIFGPINYGPS